MIAPAVLPLVMMGISAATAAAGAVGAIAAGNAQANAAKFNAMMAMDQAKATAGRQEQDTRRKLAEARAAYGAANVDIQGTPLEVMSDLATQGALDVQTTLWKGQMQAGQDQYQGQQAQTAGYVQAGGSILTGASQMAGTYWKAYGTSPAAS